MVVSLEGKVFVRTREFTLMIALLQITGGGVKKNLNQITIGSDQPHYLLNDKKYRAGCDPRGGGVLPYMGYIGMDRVYKSERLDLE